MRAQNNLIKRVCFLISASGTFHIITILAIFGNAVVLAMSRYPIDDVFEERLDWLNIGFFFFFVVELIFKIVGRGVSFYL